MGGGGEGGGGGGGKGTIEQEGEECKSALTEFGRLDTSKTTPNLFFV